MAPDAARCDCRAFDNCQLLLMHCRVSLLEGARRDRAPQETDATAGLDNRGLVQMQQSLMRQQDSQVEQLEQSVGNTRVRLWVRGGRPELLLSCSAELHAPQQPPEGAGTEPVLPKGRRSDHTPPTSSCCRCAAYGPDHRRGAVAAQPAADGAG